MEEKHTSESSEQSDQNAQSSLDKEEEPAVHTYEAQLRIQ